MAEQIETSSSEEGVGGQREGKVGKGGKSQHHIIHSNTPLTLTTFSFCRLSVVGGGEEEDLSLIKHHADGWQDRKDNGTDYYCADPIPENCHYI